MECEMKLERKELNFDNVLIDEKGIISGYGAVFDNKDFADDVIEKGAFSKCLTEKQTYPMLWQHNSDQPIGIWEECSEDEHGLLLKGRLLVDDVQQAKEAYALYKNGIINGLSIGFMCNSCTWEERDRDFIRHLTEIKLFEVSLVTFPCNEKAIVTDVKNAGLTIRSAERALLDCGFSHKQAKTILSKGFKAIQANNDDRDDPSNVCDEQKAQIELINSFFNKLKGN